MEALVSLMAIQVNRPDLEVISMNRLAPNIRPMTPQSIAGM